MATKETTQHDADRQLEQAARRYLRAVERALPHLEKVLAERRRMEKLRGPEGSTGREGHRDA